MPTMPKHTRSSSASHSRYTAQQHIPVTVDPAAIYAQQRMTMPAAAYYTVASSSAASAMPLPPQHHQQAYDPYPTVSIPSAPAAPMPPVRASNGAWTQQDDQQLIAARMQGLNWAQIKDTYFPSKTGNACRKRHERLMDKKGVDDWDTRKLQRLAQDYMSLRKEIWSPLAEKTGEKWQTVEQKCMANGLKNLMSAARTGSRRDKMERAGAPLSGYDDDSGISGLDLTPVDDLDASYSSPETNGSGSHAAAAYLSQGSHPHAHHQHHHPHHHHQQQQHHHAQLHPHAHAHLQPLAPGPNGYAAMGAYAGNGYHGYSSSGSSQDSSPYIHGQRQSSADMGIEAIIHRPGRRVA